MPLGSDAARNAVLDASLSSTAAPESLYLALFAGDPASGGVEISGGGYARVAVPRSAWAAASGGQKSNSAELTFPTSTGAWSGTATHTALMSASTGGDRWDTGALGSPVAVTESGAVVSFPAGTLTATEV